MFFFAKVRELGKCILEGNISIHENKVSSLDIVTLDIVILTRDNLKLLLAGDHVVPKLKHLEQLEPLKTRFQ